MVTLSKLRAPIEGKDPPAGSERFSRLDGVFGLSGQPVYEDLDLVRRIIDFANDETDTRPLAYGYRQAIAMEAGMYPKMDEDGEPDFHAFDKQIQEVIDEAEVDVLIARDKANASRVLRAAAENPEQLIEWLNNWSARYGSKIGMALRPGITENKAGGLKIDWRLELDDQAEGAYIANALAYAAALFLVDHEGCRRNLGFCHLPECGRFFEVERGKPGKPRRDYCSTAHMKAAHERDSARRHKESRDRKKAEAAKGRRRRSK